MILDGKVALITGGNTGIGQSTAQLFAREGAKVVIVGRRQKEGEAVVAAIKDAGGTAAFVTADVSKEEDCRTMVARTIETYGRLDIAFNNAGIGRAGKLIADEEEAGFVNVLATNLLGAFLSMKYEIPAMLSNGGGSIINTASVSGLVASPGQSAYIASKHGLLGLTKAAALEYAKNGIRVNAICPAATRTEMVKRWFSMPGVEERVTGAMPTGRIAEPDEVAKTVLFLSSEAASYVSGHPFVIDGGFVAQ
jgi:NAD(P)-dependent dehydrogenase (short-subunit alcohol dehydrogenase family)